jgi:hypothetical protein
MPDYVEVFRSPTSDESYDDDHYSNVPFRALNFYRHEGFEVAHRGCIVLDVEEPEVTVYFRTENFGGAHMPNPVGAALLWYWLLKDQPLTRVYGDLAVTGRRDKDGRPTSIDEGTLELLTGEHEHEVTLAHVTEPPRPVWVNQDTLA